DTRTPLVWVCSVLINNSRGPSSTVLTASTAFRIKFSTTCCSWTRSPWRGISASARRVRTETPFVVIALFAKAITFVDRLVQIKTTLSRRRFLDVITDSVDDISGSIGIGHDTLERFPDFAQIRRVSVQK